ncbi:putative bifunctional diguanylate cyclase/phosphodiesterase [Methylobacterium gregans]|nr:EAL domain-containing protein [Methylobacterium gregans]MDQ0522032.1 diguanylate cyclase (GGDEF)-like protein/PAS domain S-box-containing protein [Methylobacterium gregans]
MPAAAVERAALIASDWLWETDPQGTLTYLSAGAERHAGWPAADLIGQPYPMPIGAEADCPCRAAMEARRPFRDLPYAYPHPDGEPRWFALSGRPRHDRSGRFLGYRGVGSDVSDRHRNGFERSEAHVRLVEQNRRFDAALENMSQGLCMFDAKARLMVWNRRYIEIFGLDPEDLRIGMSQRAIVEILVGRGCYKPGATVDFLCEGTRTSLVHERAGAVLRELADGRIIAATHRPMPGGGWVATFEDVTERRRNEERIVHMARHDALTDLPNRTALRELGSALIGRARAIPGARVAVLCLDLDRFKVVNDSFGHATGDKLLQAVTGRLRGHLRRDDIVARLGGDEFAVLHLTQDPDGAAALAQRLIGVVSRPYRLDGRTVEIGMSAGISLSDEAGAEIDWLLQSADMALYEAKGAGRGTHCVFEPQMDEHARARRALEHELRDALTGGALELHYQPLVDLGTRRIKGLEALVRWRHPERGLISPGMFIPIAEETGLIVPLGEWVLRQACEAAARWPAWVSIAVNVSALQLRYRGFAASVLAALAASGLAAARLELEITESVLLEDTEVNLETLHTLRRLGVRISMDDFGTGYSSISYLRRFPFDKIKIDRSFVRDLGASAESSAIIRAVVGLGASLGITTLVEGVETEAQLEAVRAEGAQEMQGFLFSPPRTMAEIDVLLAAQEAGAGQAA